MDNLNKYRILSTALLLLATFFSSFARQVEAVSFKFKVASTFCQHDDEVTVYPEPHSKPKPKPPPTSKIIALLTDKIQRTWENRFFLNLDLRTNLLCDAMLSPTFGFEWHKNRYLGIKVDGSYTHWGNKHGMVDNIWFVNPEIRWYIKNTDLFYMGIGGNVGRINIYRGVVGGLFFPKDTGYQGTFFSGSISGGYKLILTRSLTFDFNLGLGCTHFKYDSFTVIDELRVYQRVKLKDVTKNLLGPTQAGASLVWKISGHKNWR